MNKSELIEALAKKQRQLTLKDVNLAVDCIIEHMCQTLIAKYLLHFKPGKELRVRVNQLRLACRTRKEDQN